MILAYLSHDEVNLDLVRRLAEAAGVHVCPVFAKDAAVAGPSDAVLYDLDSLPPAEREQRLKALLMGPLTCPVAVHSYHLGWNEVQGLRARGVGVSRLLQERVVAALVIAAAERSSQPTSERLCPPSRITRPGTDPGGSTTDVAQEGANGRERLAIQEGQV
jgi:hypothetical protein